MNKNDKILILGSSGMVGSAILRNLIDQEFEQIVGCDYRQIKEPVDGVRYRTADLIDPLACNKLFSEEQPAFVFLAAARVGGIEANNTYRARFLYENLVIQNNVIHQAYLSGVKKLLFLGSSCIYPRNAPQPIREDALLTGPLEYTNEPYAIAKIAGLKLCENYNLQYGTNFIAVMPTNLYGPNDNYDLQNSHVLPALIRKFHEAKINGAESVTIWGTGSPLREFMHVDDLAAAVVFLMQTYSGSKFVNIGWGKEITIHDLALLIREIVGFEGKLVFDTSKPDGTPRKLLNVTLLNSLGFTPTIHLREGIARTYADFVKKYAI
ncbi:MAG: GDP-L-fucose synthase [Alphaproteobacteria bacterium]|nr:GDP-L-fucose synthase [Alphaproteobacteria bacterium]